MRKSEPRKLSMLYAAPSLLCLIVAVPLIYIWSQEASFSPFNGELTNTGEGNEETAATLDSLLTRLVTSEKSRAELKETRFSCQSDLHSEICLASKEIMLEFNDTLRVYVLPTNNPSAAPGAINCTVNPYARREDETAMKAVTPIQISSQQYLNRSSCGYTHDVPVVIFSSGGFTGNLFHEFNEIIVPLFITCRRFHSRVQFVVTDYKPDWVSKYRRILRHLSSFDIMDSAQNSGMHCFPGGVIGLKYHGNLAINASNDTPGDQYYPMLEFKKFLRQAYDMKAPRMDKRSPARPLLVLISRNVSRVFTNEDELVTMMVGMGFRVYLADSDKMLDLDKFAKVVNSCSVMVGVHGAGLTNAVFLPSNAVMVQVVPLGLDWASDTYFGDPFSQMDVHYLKYNIEPDESSLIDLYGPDHPVIVDPASVFSKGYYAARAMYVDGQNVRINITRFKRTLAEAIHLLQHGIVPPKPPSTTQIAG